MYIWFWVFAVLILVSVPLHFVSVEHKKLQKRYGKEKGKRIGNVFGMISGTMESIALLGLWISPQPRFVIPVFPDLIISIFNFSIQVLNLVISLPLIAAGAWFGIKGVRAIGMEVADTHGSPKKIETNGVYAIVRNPQYLGWILAHVGISLLLSVWYSMLFSPVLLLVIYLISRKEEQELINEFGKEYLIYQKRVPMFMPKIKF